MIASLKKTPASKSKMPVKAISSIEILNALFAFSFLPFPESILIAMQPPTAKSAASILIAINIGKAKVTTDNDKSSRYWPIITVSAIEPIAVVRFIRIVGASIVRKTFFTIGLCL